MGIFGDWRASVLSSSSGKIQTPKSPDTGGGVVDDDAETERLVNL